MRRRLADERGSALTLFAVIAPVFILFLALALDVGNWFTHKRNLQNRADAAALAAGVQYTTNENADLIACKNGDPGNTAGTDITSWAKKYAGDPGVAGSLNTQVANQGSLSISVNSSTFGGTDWSDAAGNTGSPCFFHPANASDFISPKGGYWTDVKVKETNIPTLFGAFGINVPAITARARLEVRAIGSINPFGPTIPFVGQSGDFVPCAWARFVDYQGNPLPAGQVGGTNPLPLGLVSGETREWEATMPTISTSAQNVDDIGVQAVLGFPQTARQAMSAVAPMTPQGPRPGFGPIARDAQLTPEAALAAALASEPGARAAVIFLPSDQRLSPPQARRRQGFSGDEQRLDDPQRLQHRRLRLLRNLPADELRHHRSRRLRRR